jgi:hypothetical protein
MISPVAKPPTASRENSRTMPLSENAPATIAARANLKPTRPVASFIRLSPFRTVVSRDGTRRRWVMALTATASVGETIAPRAKAMASGRPGTSHQATRPTVTVVKITSPMARMRMERRLWTNSRRGISQPSAKSSGGRKQRKKYSGSSFRRGNPGTSATPIPPSRYVMSGGQGSQRPITLKPATSRSRMRLYSKISMRAETMLSTGFVQRLCRLPT